MGKLPGFLFYPGDWLKDPELRRCTKAEKGVWIDMLAVAFECADRGVFATGGEPWKDKEIAEAIGGSIAKNLTCLRELLRKGVARRNELGAIYSSRMVRDEQERRTNSARKQNQRLREKCHANVTHSVTPLSVSESEDVILKKEKPKEMETPELDSDEKLTQIAMLHPKLSHLAEWEISRIVFDGIIDAVAGERKLRGISESEAFRYVFDETKRVVETAKKAGKSQFLKGPADFWKPGIAQYRRPDSDFQAQGPPPQPKIKVSPPGTNSLANQVEALRRAEEAKKAPQTQTQ